MMKITLTPRISERYCKWHRSLGKRLKVSEHVDDIAVTDNLLVLLEGFKLSGSGVIRMFFFERCWYFVQRNVCT